MRLLHGGLLALVIASPVYAQVVENNHVTVTREENINRTTINQNQTGGFIENTSKEFGPGIATHGQFNKNGDGIGGGSLERSSSGNDTKSGKF